MLIATARGSVSEAAELCKEPAFQSRVYSQCNPEPNRDRISDQLMLINRIKSIPLLFNVFRCSTAGNSELAYQKPYAV